MIRFVHTGDMHFDSPFAALPSSVARVRKEEQKRAFLRIIEAVKEYRADMLLISGDMFDAQYVSADTVSFLKKCFLEIRDVAVFVAPGNHDFLSEDSPYKRVDFGENVHIFGETLERVEREEAVIYGFGFPSRFVTESPLPKEGIHTGEKPGILLMHGDVGTESDYNPISPAILSKSGFLYAALGHIHTYSGIFCAGDVAYAYPGIPEGRHFDEPEKGGFILGEITGGELKLEFIPVAFRQNVTLEVDVSDLATLDAVEDKIRALLQKENLYKIVLCGEISNTMFLDTQALSKRLDGACLYLKITDNTTLCRQEEASLLEKRFVERLSTRGDAVAKEALRLGLSALRRQGR